MLHVFDLDHTLLRVNGSFHFGMFLAKNGMIHYTQLPKVLLAYFLHKVCRGSLERLHRTACEVLFKGTLKAGLSAQAMEFVQQSFLQLTNGPIFTRFNAVKDRGEDVLILSSSPDFIVSAVAAYLGNIVWGATEYITDREGRVQGIGAVMNGANKALFLKRFLDEKPRDRENIVVYTDSILDLPLLEMAGNIVCTHPDRHLRQICLDRDGKVL